MAGQYDGNEYGLLPALNDFFLRDWLSRNFIPSHSAPHSPLFYLTPGPAANDFNDGTSALELMERKGAMSLWRINVLAGHLLFIVPPFFPPADYEFDATDWLYNAAGGDTKDGGGLPDTDGGQTQFWTFDNNQAGPYGVPMTLCVLMQSAAFPVGEMSSGSYDVVMAVVCVSDFYDVEQSWAEVFNEYQPDEVAMRSEGLPDIMDQAGMKGDRPL